MIQKVVGETVNVISTEEAVAREVNRRLQQENLLSAQQTPGSTLLLTNSERSRFKQQVDTLWGKAAIDTF